MAQEQEPHNAPFAARPPAVLSTIGSLRAFLVTICSASTLYIELHGHYLSRHGCPSLIVIRPFPHVDIYVIDIQELGRDAFSARSVFGLTLQSILENPGIRKCFWDVRNASDALWAHYHIHLQGVTDLQLLENASRQPHVSWGWSKTYVHGLDTAIRLDLQLQPAEAQHEIRLRRVMAARLPQTAFRLRPLDTDALAYCANGIRYLPRLHRLYMERIAPRWLAKAKAETVRRVDVAFAPAYDPLSPSKALGPWGSEQQKKAGPFLR